MIAECMAAEIAAMTAAHAGGALAIYRAGR
jgi:hypothetical protein